jgi:putative spermidine/putrescine transport system substrate-binding protein
MRKTRIIAVLMLVALCGFVIAGCQAKGPTQLVVATWGGSSEKGLTEIVKSFEEENNVDIVFDIGNNSDRLNKIRATKDSPVIDVALMTDCFSVMGNDEGLFEQVDVANVPNIEKLYDYAVDPSGFGPAYSVVSYGIVYNTEMVDQAPTSWADMWDPAYENLICIPDITSTAGPMLLVTAAQMNGGSMEDIDAGFEKMEELKPNIFNFYTSVSDVITMFERGEIAMAPFMDIFVPIMHFSDLPVEIAVLEDGNFAGYNTVNVVKGTENKEIAEKFVNFMLEAETQAQIATALFEAPTNVDVEVSEAGAKYMSYGPEKMESLVMFDWSYINDIKPEWIERWNKEITAE